MNDNGSVPSLADEITISQLDHDTYIVSNPLHRHFIKVNSDTYHLLSLIDGEKTLAQVCTSFNLKHRREIDTKVVAELLQNKLAPYGVLKGFDHLIRPYQRPSYLKLSFSLVKEKPLSGIVVFFDFMFIKWVAAVLTIGSLTIITSLLYLNFHLYQPFNLPDSILYVIPLMTASLILHEIGHATATHHFGARHGGIGIGFYLLSPVFYADVTDVWRLSKRQRIIVNLAGVYFELVFCALVLIVGACVKNNSLVIVSITIFIQTLFNLNPFLRSDGYWIFSDLTGIPNLMNHSGKRMLDAWKWLQGIKPAWSGRDLLLFVYGITNLFITGVFLFYVLFRRPNVILFPKRLIEITEDLVSGKCTISFGVYLELVLGLTFYILVFGLVKNILRRKHH